MGLLKKNPLFYIICVTALLVFVGLSALAVIEFGQLSKLKQQSAKVDRQLQMLLYADPTPSADNLQAAQQNATHLQAQLHRVCEKLKRGSLLTISNDGVRVMSGLQKYIAHYRKQVTTHLDANEVAAPIQVPDNFAFGFEAYIETTTIPEGEFIVLLDQQRKVLSYVLDQLIDADPSGIQAVEREALELPSDARNVGFRVNPAVSARVPDAIDTLAFRITFTGYTSVLRTFLNNLARFELPVVVRSVEVKRSSTASVQASSSGSQGNLEDIFGIFGDSSAAVASPATASETNRTPVISETESSFTVTLEFIEIILTSDSEAESNPS